MEVYPLSQISRSRFNPERTVNVADYRSDIQTVSPLLRKLSYNSNSKSTHYGKSVFSVLDKLLPDIWTYVDRQGLDNSNRNGSDVVWYLDGSEQFTLKHLLTTVSSYAIKELDANDYYNDRNEPTRAMMIQKPSHPYIGSGQLVTVSDNLEELLGARPLEYRMSGRLLYPINHWIVQPLISPLLWAGKKFDCRFYAAVYANKARVGYRSFEYGVARTSVNPYNPRGDSASAITNVSVQERLAGFDAVKNVLLVRDDVQLVDKMVDELLTRSTLTTDRDKLHVIILGLDVLIDEQGRPRLIEVNHEPYLEVFSSGAENFCSLEVVREVFGRAIPSWVAGDVDDVFKGRGVKSVGSAKGSSYRGGVERSSPPHRWGAPTGRHYPDTAHRGDQGVGRDDRASPPSLDRRYYGARSGRGRDSRHYTDATSRGDQGVGRDDVDSAPSQDRRDYGARSSRGYDSRR